MRWIYFKEKKIISGSVTGIWEQDYGWWVRVRRPFGARGRISVRYGTRLGDLEENWFLFVFQLNTQHTPKVCDRKEREREVRGESEKESTFSRV